MKQSHIYLIIAILILCFFIYTQFKHRIIQKEKQVTQEGFWNEIGKEIENTFNKVIEALKRAFNEAKRAITGIIDDISRTFESIGHQFSVIPVRLRRLNSAFEKSGQGIRMQFENLGIALKTGFDDTFELIGDGGSMSIEYLLCGLYKLSKLPMCIVFYVFDIFRFFFGLFFRSLICAVELYFDTKNKYKLDLNAEIDKIKVNFKVIDKQVEKYTGYSFMSYPEYIEKNCYNCQFSRTAKQLAQQANLVSYDFNVLFPELMKQPAYKFRDAGHDFRDVGDPNL